MNGLGRGGVLHPLDHGRQKGWKADDMAAGLVGEGLGCKYISTFSK